MSSVPAASSPSVSSTSSLLSSLSLQSHPIVTSQLASAQRLVTERRYRQAEEQVKAFMQDTQKEIKEAAAKNSTQDQTANVVASSSSSIPSLPTLSQLMTSFLPFLRTLGQLRKENESAEYDLSQMTEEIERYKKEQAKAAAAAATTADGDSSSAPKAVRPLHAEYVHPQLQLASIAGRGRGVIAVAPGLPVGCAAPASSSSPTSSDEEDCSTTSSSSSHHRIPVIPRNTTIMVSKAIGFVTAPALKEGPAASQQEQEAHEEKMANALVTLLALKMGQDQTLIPELYALDAGERYDADRERRLAIQPSPLNYGRPIPALAAPIHEGETSPEDLEIDLARLALLVARNAFATPQPMDVENDSEGESESMTSTGLWLTCSLLNHSCHPNSHWFCVGDFMFVRTLKPIYSGEELTISYTGFDAKLYTARQARCNGWGFECRCKEWCEPFIAHPSLIQIETEFEKSIDQLETKVHQLVDTVHTTEDSTVQHRNALSELKSVKLQIEKLVDSFKSRVGGVCGKECERKGPKEESEDDGEAITALPPVAEVKSKKKKGMGGSAAAASPAASSSDSSLFASSPQHTRCLLIHLAVPLQLLALCSVSLHDASSATVKSYKSSIILNEKLTLQSIDLYSRQYGAGDEVCITAWFQLLNTWIQFSSGGIDYRSIDEMKAVFTIVMERHCKQFGVKEKHFMKTWTPLLETMGLMDLTA